MRYPLDADAVISVLNTPAGPVHTGSTPSHRQTLASVPSSCTSYTSARSRAKGAHKLARVDALRFEVLPLDTEDAHHAGEIRACLAAQGTPIGAYDILIAGQACTRGLVLITRKLREFERVHGLSTKNWQDEAGTWEGVKKS